MARTSRIRQIGWLIVLGLSLAVFLALTFKVNAVKSEVRLLERQIIAAEKSKRMLETEFQTRASQHQLAAWNEVEFGYRAPRADQYVEHERQLAFLGTPRGSDAPKMIRVAKSDTLVEEDGGLFSDLLGSDGGEEVTLAAVRVEEPTRHLATSLAQRLARPAAPSVAMAEAAQ